MKEYEPILSRLHYSMIHIGNENGLLIIDAYG